MGKDKSKKINSAVSIFSLRSTRQKRKKVWQASFIALLSCSFLISVWILPAVSADRIAFSYGVFGEFYVSIADLEVFAKKGKITPSFAYYADRLSQENLAKLRVLLNQSFEINQVTASIFLNLPIGKQLTKELGLIIDAPSKVSQPALRGALVLAAAEPEGLTILNVLRHYSTKTLKLNTERIVEAVNEATRLLADTERVFRALEGEVKNRVEIGNRVDVSTLADLRKSGSKKWRKKFLTIKPNDNEASQSSGDRVAYTHSRAKLAGNRTIEGVVYLPVASDEPAPLVVIAPGLNTDWQSFSYIAQHLASYGFGVAAVNFPGTNAQRIDAVLNGLDTPPSDNQWVLQPKVVTRLLDEIERKSKSDSEWQGKLNLQKVGILGQSLGGYTAMAIAGAKVDWQHLQEECREIGRPEQIDFNPALFWQCQGAANSIPDTDLQDKRIVAAIAINPVTNPVFSQKGMSQLKSPLTIVTGDADLFAPALDEQIEPFTWLSEIDKYLVLVKNSTHFSFIGEGSDEVELSSAIDLDSSLARSYLKVLGVAFFKTHLAQQPEFKVYLTESYFKTISKQPLPINLLRSLDGDRLKELIKK